MGKKYDLVVKVGEKSDGKGIFKNVGSVFEGKDGKNDFVLLDKTFNPAGVPTEDGKTSVLINMFTPKDQQSAPGSGNNY